MKVLIVDDERLALENLADLIDWAAEGCALVGTAIHGADALRMMKSCAADIVISDIRMPVMDGLELCKELRRLYPQTRVVLLTAYRDFEYAQQAMRYGAVDYLLKNQLDEASLTLLLRRIRGEVAQEAKRDSAVQDQYYQDLLLNIAPPERTSVEMDQTDVICVLVRRKVPFVLNRLAGYDWPDAVVERAKLQQHLPEGIDLRQLVGLDRSSWGLLLQSENGQTAERPTLREALLKGLRRYFELEVGFRVAVLFDTALFSPEAIRASFARLLDAAKYSLFWREDQALFYRDILKRCVDEDDDHENVKREVAQISTALQCANGEAIHMALESVHAYIATPLYNLARFQYAFARMTDLLESVRSSNDLPPLRERVVGMRQELFVCDSFPAIWAWLRSEFDLLMRCVGVRIQIPADRKIALALAYIDKNYGQKLTAKSVGEVVGLSEVYFSNLFKKETGITFLEYLTAHRINIAKHMLLKGTYKVYEISEKTGYTSPQYFSQIFQKITGVTPQQYSHGGHGHEAGY